MSYDSYYSELIFSEHVTECEINGKIIPYDACDSSMKLEDAIAWYGDRFTYIGSNNGIIYVDGVKNNFKTPHHFFIRLSKQEARKIKLNKLNALL